MRRRGRHRRRLVLARPGAHRRRHQGQDARSRHLPICPGRAPPVAHRPVDEQAVRAQPQAPAGAGRGETRSFSGVPPGKVPRCATARASVIGFQVKPAAPPGKVEWLAGQALRQHVALRTRAGAERSPERRGTTFRQDSAHAGQHIGGARAGGPAGAQWTHQDEADKARRALRAHGLALHIARVSGPQRRHLHRPAPGQPCSGRPGQELQLYCPGHWRVPGQQTRSGLLWTAG